MYLVGTNNDAAICGIIKNKPEIGMSKNGHRKAKVRVVCGNLLDNQGQQMKTADGKAMQRWVSITAWGMWVDILASASAGTSLVAMGTLRTWQWNGKDCSELVIGDEFGFIMLHPESVPCSPSHDPAFPYGDLPY